MVTRIYTSTQIVQRDFDENMETEVYFDIKFCDHHGSRAFCPRFVANVLVQNIL